jgi:hypothetical protein
MIMAAVLLAGLALAFYKVRAMHRPVLALACRAGVGAACVQAAWEYVDDQGPRALAFLQHGCDRLRGSSSCAALTEFIAVGLVSPADFARAEKMCLTGDRRFGAACVQLAELTILGQFGDYERPKRTTTFYARGCELGDQAGCTGLRTAAEQLRAVDRFSEMAKACVEGHGEACDQLISRFR